MLGSSWAGVVVSPFHPSDIFQSSRGEITAGEAVTAPMNERAKIEAKRIVIMVGRYKRNGVEGPQKRMDLSNTHIVRIYTLRDINTACNKYLATLWI